MLLVIYLINCSVIDLTALEFCHTANQLVLRFVKSCSFQSCESATEYTKDATLSIQNQSGELSAPCMRHLSSKLLGVVGIGIMPGERVLCCGKKEWHSGRSSQIL